MFKKKVKICLHPRDDLFEKKEIFKDFEIIQHKTTNFIPNLDNNYVEMSIFGYCFVKVPVIQSTLMDLWSHHFDQ